jgi:hypothetical protein
MNFMARWLKNFIKKCILHFRISVLYGIKYNFSNNTLFNNELLDKKIENFALQLNIKKHEKTLEQNNVAFFATELYDQGGHSVLLKNILQNIPKNYNAKLFLTKKSKTIKTAKKRIAQIAKNAEIDGVNFSFKSEKKLLKQMFNKIMDFSPKTIFAFIHMNDAFAVAILSLIKKHTDIKILFMNFAAHHPCLGMSFADLILELSPCNAFVTQKYRGFANTHIVWLAGENKENLAAFSEEQIGKTRAQIGIPKNCLCTMTGCASYKLLYGKTSPFLELIYELLKKHNNLYHVLITNLNDELNRIINSIFCDSEIKKRLLILNFVADYKLLFKCADVFIDSFPISNDLTMVDLMSLKIPFVFMINTENLTQSFNEYMPQGYPYMFCNIKDFEHGAEKLLFSEQEQNKVVEINYEHFLNIFEGKKVAEKIFGLANCEDFSQVYSKINEQDYKGCKEPKLIPIV